MSGLPVRVRLVIFDLDGVVYRGSEAVPGAAQLVEFLHRHGAAIRFATNNSTATRSTYVDRLAGMGIRASAEEIVTSTSATIEHLHRHAPDVGTILAIGADGMEAELREAGFAVTMAGAAVAGLDPAVDYARLSVAMAAVAGGARLIATNADARYPTPAGFLPGAGAIVAALVTTTGVTPEVIGKPSPAMFTAILDAAGVAPSESVVVGDNPDADVAGAHRAGCPAILVLTGVADSRAVALLDGERVPDAVAADPDEVRALLASRLS
jgi:4-nitrophenyl phosphatase